MVTIELKPVSDETIAEMGYSNHDLWLVKKDATVYGPFETQSLRHYSIENSQIFIGAEACLVDSHEWLAFFEVPQFQRRVHSPDEQASSGPYWLILNGQKSGPLTEQDIGKKLEMGLISRTDLFSPDDGFTWKKIYLIPAFDRRRTSESLPNLPHETSFEKAKHDVGEKMESQQGESQQDGLASLAFLGQKKEKTVVLKLDEITLEAIQETDISRSLKWFIPAMVASLLVLSVTAWYFVKPKPDRALAEVSESDSKKVTPQISLPTYQAQPQPQPANQPSPSVRRPNRQRASSAPARPHYNTQAAGPVTHQQRAPESEYPTHVETHSPEREPANHEQPTEQPTPEPYQDQPEEQPPQDNLKEEQNLVNSNGDRANEQDPARYPARNSPEAEAPVIDANDY